MEKKKKAVALRYEPAQDNAPVVLAKGSGAMAEMIIQKAEDHGIAVVEDGLMSGLLMQVGVLQEIPQELYRAVAVLFRELYKLDGEYTP
jgi:flagellar biosynthesis protein